MSQQAFKDRTAIVGLGWTPFTKDSGSTVSALAARACLDAIEDAGLSVRDIDGVVTYAYQREWETTVAPRELIHALGIENCQYQLFDILGGTQPPAYVAAAAMAVYAGIAKNVLVYRAMNGRSERGGGGNNPARGVRQWTVPFGMNHAAASFGIPVVAHMARFGTTSEDLGNIAVTQRRHAMLNTKAMMRTPLTIEEHQQSPWLVYPYHLYDCCLQTDGAVALVVSSADQAKDLKQSPVYIMSALGGVTPNTGPLWETSAEHAAPILYEGAGITVDDIDFAELYDPFTGMCLLHIEGFGLAPPGQGASWIAAGNMSLDGVVPVNTHGGLLSEGYMQGLNHVVEAVQQLRSNGVIDDCCDGTHDYDRSHCRQVRDPHIALVCGEAGNSSMILRGEK